MRKHHVHVIQIIVIISILFTSFGIPQKVKSNTTDSNIAENIYLTAETETLSEPPDNLALTRPEYEVVQNADPYLMSLALGNEEKVSRYGPNRNDPDEGIPDHAYSPFDDLDKREVCPPGGCDYVAGKVLIKFEAEQEFSLTRSNEIQLQDQVLASALDTLEITNLSPVFPNVERPAPGEMIETVDGALIEKPDLTRWFQAESTSDKGLGEVIQALQTTAGVAFAEPDFVRKPIGEMTEEINSISQSTSPSTLALPGSTTDPLYDQQWHLGATHVPEAWAYLESLGLPPGGSRDIVVAVIDTGVDYTHPDLAANIWVNPAEFNGTPGVDDDGNGYVDDIHGADTVYPDGNPMDDHGHGTHVAGIIAAQADNDIGGVGVAYNVQVMPIKAAQYSGVLASSDIAEAIYYAVAKGADVINMSFGGYARSTVEEDALAVAFGQAVLVAAAGNDGKVNLPCPYGIDMYPAAYNWVLGVMAQNQYPNVYGDFLANFSNRDCKTQDEHEYELMVPGVSIWSTLPNVNYAAWSGTSMAAPIVSGIAALVRTKWSDNDIYSSRFIMGQLSTTGSLLQAYTPLPNPPVNFRTGNALTAITTSPKPNLTYIQHWLFDTTDLNPINDNDGIVDAGEIVDLAVVIRNHWGKAENVTVTLEAWAEGAVSPDPYVTFFEEYSTVSYGSVGSFNSDDNGLVYNEEGVATGVQNPFRFEISVNTPNNHIIQFKLTMTADNGYDLEDPDAPYTFVSYFYCLVQKGRELPSIIPEDITLSSEYYWILNDTTLIPTSVTVTITEGTEVQFGTTSWWPFLQVEGTLNIIGSHQDPVILHGNNLNINPYIVPRVSIINYGTTNISYTHITNPELGKIYQPYQLTGSINNIDHVIFTSDRYVEWKLKANTISKSILYNLTGGSLTSHLRYEIGLFDSVLIDSVYPLDNGLNNELRIGTRVESAVNKVDNSVFIQENCLNKPIQWTFYDSSLINHTSNAFLSKIWDLDNSHWMKITVNNDVPRDIVFPFENNYFGTTSASIIDQMVYDTNDDFNLATIDYDPYLTVAPESAYPFVVDVILTTTADPDATAVGAEPVTFTVTFNRDMDQTVQPQVSFGPDVPMTDYTVHPIDGGWQDARTWVGTFNITPVTGDGYQLIRVAGAVAADDPWLVTGDDAGRFRFEVITSGTEAMNLQATGGEGYVDLMWTQTDFDLLSGFHLYRSTTIDGTYTRINSSIIPPETRSYRDIDVIPGQPYYYKFTVVKSDMSESDFSNTATATPLDTIPPALVHTPVTSAEPGQPLTLTASATDNVNVAGVTLYYRHVGDVTYLSTPMVETTADQYYATIAGSYLTSPGVEYYIEATDGISITRNGRSEDPNLVSVIDRPVVTGITPNSGPSEGGTLVTISGSNFKDGATVTFGGMAASNVVFISSSQITCNTPAHIPETVDVRVTNPDAQYGLLLNGFTFISTAAQISMPNTGGGTGNIVTVPVNAANINGMLAASLTVNFDPAVLSVQSASTGTLTAGWAFASNLVAPGQFRLSMSSTSGVSGSGTLANIEFEVIGAPGSSSALTISNILLNDGAITIELTDGLFSVDDVYNVSGLVSFWNGDSPVPGTTLTLTGDQVYSALSGADGNYNIQGAAIDTYTLSPSKSDGDNEISAYDASFALQHDVGLITLTGNQALAGDVNSNGAITSMDAAYILQKAADLITLPFPGSGVVWKFNPAERTIAELTSNITGQNFTGVLLGDISGNWTDPGETPQATVAETRAASAVITIPDVTVLPGGTADIPIALDITDAELLGADIVFTYDPTHIAVSDVRLGALAAGWGLASNLTEPGVVRIAMAGAMPITTDGELILFTITTLGASGTQSILTLTRGELNEGAIPSTLDSGSVYIAVPPIADFSATPTSGIAPLTVSFTNLSTGDWTSSSWDFGDGATSNEENPSHSFATAGIYTVSLTVTGSGGSDIETKTAYITVYDPVSANFSATPTNGIAPLTVNFTNLSTGDWTSSSWDFGDGTTSTENNPTHQYNTAGTYSISLSVTGLGGSDTETKIAYITVFNAVTADFSSTPTSGITPLSVDFTNLSSGDWTSSSWDFGDGSTSTDNNPIHQYNTAGTFTVSLNVSGPGGSDTETKTNYITVYEPVSADFSGTPTSGIAPLSVGFTNLSTGDWSTSSWSFGDGETSTENNPTHQYLSAGTYTVSLTVTGPGGSDIETKTGFITVYEPVSADFSGIPTSGIAPLSVSFTNLSTGDWSTSSWSFGDGETSTENNPTHQYLTAGTYTVSLSVTGLGGSDSETKIAYLTVLDPVNADFSATPTSGAAPLSVSFTNLSTGDWTTSSWDFGDGATSTENNPSHSYTTPGTYTVSLTVTGPGGSDTELKTDYIQVSTLSISGQVLYWNASKAIPDAQITMKGDNPYSDTTDSAGSFSISGILSGSYTLTPAKNDNFTGITAYDAALVLRHAAEISSLTGYPATSADVDKSGAISPMDASYILQKSVGSINEFSTEYSMWQFDPQNYSYPTLTENQSNQDFTALLLGDVSGSWTAPVIPTGMNDLPSQRQTTASISVESKTVLTGANFDIAIDLTNMGEEILAGDIILTYDPEVIKISNVSSGSLVSDWPIAFNLETPGVIRIAIADTLPVNESGEFIILSGTAIGSPGDETEIGFSLGSLNEGSVSTELLPGLITIDNGEVPPNKIYLPLIIK